jgi:hypothetical protein
MKVTKVKPAAMKPAAIFDRLVKLALRDHHEGKPLPEGKVTGMRDGHPWTAADLVAQEALFEIQADVLDILLDLARELGPKHVDRLARAMPWAYSVGVVVTAVEGEP